MSGITITTEDNLKRKESKKTEREKVSGLNMKMMEMLMNWEQEYLKME